ncbi:hypothetical protein DM02DRAFT_109980 [Periconia macrospinosa]|uniref:Uncharacterized protein n=1 Tax=Periconia macrospinosa TaxID=97972 RepID=A0A2V1E4F5_9PLEO|nr:hypothetical protein DM02DRAFT_109980 [Periconia macrospinosa]
MTSLFVAFTLLSRICPSLAETPTPTFKIVETSTLIPPYGTGPAVYYASSMGDDWKGTTYAISCVPQTTVNDPCQTATYGNSPQLFFQGSFDWYIVRSEVSTSASHLGFKTHCNVPTPPYQPGRVNSKITTPPPLPSCATLPTPFACQIQSRGQGVTSKIDMCSLGLRQHEVFMVESLPTSQAMASSSSLSFTDIGRTVTGAPIPTITLFEQPPSLGTTGKEVGRGVVGLAIAAVVMLAVG